MNELTMNASKVRSRRTRRNWPWQFEQRWKESRSFPSVTALLLFFPNGPLQLVVFPFGPPCFTSWSALASKWHRSNRCLPYEDHHQTPLARHSIGGAGIVRESLNRIVLTIRSSGISITPSRKRELNRGLPGIFENKSLYFHRESVCLNI